MNPDSSNTKARRSLQRGTKDYIAQTIPLDVQGDKFHFNVRDLSSKAIVAIDSWPEETAKLLGCPTDIAGDNAKRVQWYQEHNSDKLPDDHPLIVDGTCPLGCRVYAAEILLQPSLWEIPILDALVSWDSDDPCTPESIKGMPPMVKKSLHDALVVTAATGVGAEQFFRRRDATGA